MRAEQPFATFIGFAVAQLFTHWAHAGTPVPYRWGEIKPSTAEGYVGRKILIAWDSPEGKKRLARSRYSRDFYQLAHAFQPQENPVFATIASAVMVLNAMRQPRNAVASDPAHEIKRPSALGGDVLPFPAYSQSSFLNQRTDAIKDRKLILLEVVFCYRQL
jgi:hypothetical protein